MLLDLRLAVRRLAGRPLPTLVTIATLALGVGANTAAFTVLEALILKPLPLERPDRLVRVRQVRATDRTVVGEVSFPDLADWRRGLDQIEDLAAFATFSGGLPVKLAKD